MRTSTHLLVFLLVAVSGCLFPGCKPELASPTAFPLVSTYNSKVLQDWNDKFLEIERDADGYRPLPATRTLAYLGLSAYEACITGMPGYKSITMQYAGLQIPAANNPETLHWPTVVNASYGYLMHRFFPTFDAQATALEDLNNGVYQTQIDAATFSLSQQYGRDVAAAVWAWSKIDAIGHDAYLDPFSNYDWSAQYTGPGDWVPTLPEPGKPLFPYWGQVRTFVIQPADKLCAPPGSDSLYQVQGQEILAISYNLTYDQKWIAEFWQDDFLQVTFSAGPRWIAIANQVYAQEEVDLEKALYTNVKLGFALNDATVACWFSKYYYNREVPKSLIVSQFDPNWQPLLNNPLTGQAGLTPAYPAYPSEHATMGAAAAAVLTNIFGDHYPMADRCHENESSFLGIPRNFSSFNEMAAESAESRIYNGVNFRMDAQEGLNFGVYCGQKVNALQWTN